MVCPECSAPARDLTLSRVMVARPTGTYSIAGQQDKVVARAGYRLTCGQCGWSVTGEIHGGYLVPFGGGLHA